MKQVCKQPSAWLKPFLSLLLILAMGMMFPVSGLIANAADASSNATTESGPLIDMELAQKPGGHAEWADGYTEAKRQCESEEPLEVKVVPDEGYHAMGLLVWNEYYHNGNIQYMEPVSMSDILDGTVDIFTVKARGSIIYPIFVKDEDLEKKYTFSLNVGEHGTAYLEDGGTSGEFLPGEHVVFYTEPDDDYFPDYVRPEFDESKAAFMSMGFQTTENSYMRWEFDMPATDVSADATFTEMSESSAFRDYQVLNDMLPSVAFSASDVQVGQTYTLGTVTLEYDGGLRHCVPGSNGYQTTSGFNFVSFQGTGVFAGAQASYQPSYGVCTDCHMAGHTPHTLTFWCATPGAAAGSFTGPISGTCIENKDGRAVFSGTVTTPNAGYQNAAFGIFAVHYNDSPTPTPTEEPTPTPTPEPEPGRVRFQKVSANPSCTNGNSAYDLTGARYGIYSNSSCTRLVDTVTVLSNTGYTGWSDELEDGIYYVKEISKPNKGYDINNNSKSFRIYEGRDTTEVLNGNMAEPPLDDPVMILVQKAFSNQTTAGKPQGNVVGMAGVKFRVDYYANIYNSVAAAQASGRPDASAIFATNQLGLLNFANASPVDGTSWPHKASGYNTFPLGTVVITEISALDGMIVSGDPKAFTVTDAGGTAKITQLAGWPTQTVSSGVVGAYTNDIWTGGVTVYKADVDAHAQTPQGDGSLAGISYQIINKSANSVMFGGNEIAVNGVVTTITTNNSGVATVSGLPYGSYTVTESAGNASYRKANWSKDFSITQNGQMVNFNAASNWNEDQIKRGSIEITKADADTGTSRPQGNGDLANTKYDIYNKSVQKVYVNGAWYAKDAKIATIATTWNAAKNAYIARIDNLPYGTYEIRESAAPAGYLMSNYSQTVEIRTDGELKELKDVASKYNTDSVMRGDLTVYKADADEHKQNAQGDGSLAGISYEIVNKSNNAVIIGGRSIAPNGICGIITTNDAGVANFNGLPYGSYTITEIAANASYNKANWSKDFNITSNGQMVAFNTQATWNEDAVKRGAIEITKADADTGVSQPQGDGELVNTHYDVYNRSAQKVYVHGVWYAKDAKIATIQTMWNASKNAHIARLDDLPYGTYEIVEAAAPTGYLKADYSQTVQIRTDGELKELKDAASKYNTDQVMRGGVTVYKADADEHKQNPQGDGSLDGIQYQIVNRSLHPIVLDGKTVAVGDVCATITSSTKDGITSATFNGLPYGSYTITETAANDSYNKADWSKDFSIRQDGQMVTFDQANGWNEDAVKRGAIEITKADFDTGLSHPQGDADLTNTQYDVYNCSARKVYVNNAWYAKDDKIATIRTEWDAEKNAFIARIEDLPYGTYEIVEVAAPTGYLKADYSQTVQIREEGELKELKDASSGYNTNKVMRGGVSITKADADWHRSEAQGDATLEGVQYQIINRSQNAVYMLDTNKLYEPGDVITTLTTKWNEETNSYMVATDSSYLPYGTYELVEVTPSTGYHNAEWHQTFTIRNEGEMQYFDSASEGETADNASHHTWNENAVMRGGIIVGKIDRETGTYISLGEAHLDGAVFEVINRSKQPVYVNGETFAVDATIMNITTEQTEFNGRTVYAATTGNNTLPYGTYEVREISSGTGYLFDSTSKAYTRTVEIRDEGQMIDLTDETDCAANQVSREDWHFQKKASDTMERMNGVPFLVESMTTGEKHIIVTDENGYWGSDATHSVRANANDPTSPVSNGAVKVAEDGTWTVEDSSKLDPDAGVWFTGVSETMSSWNADGKSYVINGKTVAINDKLRAFPYDTYRVQELRCDNNVGYNLVHFTVTLHRYTADHDGPGIDLDYGTIDDKYLSIGTTLTYGTDKVAPAGKDVVLSDTVSYSNLDANKTYTLKGELHLVNDDMTDGGVVSTAESSFNAGSGTGKTVVEFTVDTSELQGKSLVAYEYLYENGQMLTDHEDIEDEDQTVTIPEIKTTLTGDLDHISNAGATEIVLTDTISYKNLEPGKEYIAHGTLMDKATGKEVTDRDGHTITAQNTFVPTSTNGRVNVVFTFSNVDLAGKTVVAFESVTKDDVEYAVHADIEDADQSVQFPKIDTFAVDHVDANKDLAEAKDQEVRDVIRTENLNPAYDYRLVGELHIRNQDGSDGGVLTDSEDKPYAAELSWTGNEDVQDMVFIGVDARKLGGKDLVVYQTLYGKTGDRDWVVLGEHKDISNTNQTVHVPHIGTTLVTDQEIHESQVPADGMITLTDTISYENLTPGHEYVVTGTLHVQDVSENGEITDGGEVKDGFKTVQAKASFIAEEKNGTVDVTFTFDASDLDGKSITAFEALYSSPVKDVPEEWKEFFDDQDEDFSTENPDDEWITAKHEDIDDEGQTIHFAKIKTTLKSDAGLHTTQVPTGEDKTVTLTDTISYTNLIPGREYMMTGTLHLQDVKEDGQITDGGAVKDGEGNDVTSSVTFTPMTPNGKVDVLFTFDASALNGKTVVAFEEVSVDGKKFAVHTDITDESQSVHFAKLGTTALTDMGLHEIQIPKGEDRTITITDTVKYENVVPNVEYTVSGTLHLQSVGNDGSLSDGGAIKDQDGNEIIGTTTFTPDKANGTVDVVFTLDASQLNGTTLVAFETLYRKDKPVAIHQDITDEKQSVSIIDIETTALADNGLHETQVPAGEDKTVTITDTVRYTNLIPGTEYKMSGTLHLRDIDSDGKITDKGEIKGATADTTFIPETSNGTVELKFTFDASELDGKTVVAFEELYKNDILVAIHTDIEDDDQSVSFVNIHTTALAENGQHMVQVPAGDDTMVTIVDTVTYENLKPGTMYTVKGVLHIQDINENGQIKDGGVLGLSDDDPSSMTKEELLKSGVMGETIFTPEQPNGTVDVTFTFDAKALSGKTVVVFEAITLDDKVIATHEDIEDEEQSVNFVKIRTRALAENGEHEMVLPENETKSIKITDLVEYKNLIPGNKYKMTGTFHIQSIDANGVITDGGVLKDANGEPITSEVTFKPKTADGSVEVEFKIEAPILQNKTIVAFETLSSDDVIIAVHEDIEDEYQSVKFVPEEKPPVEEPPVEQPPVEIVKTGQAIAYVLFTLLGVALLTGAGYVLIKKRK